MVSERYTRMLLLIIARSHIGMPCILSILYTVVRRGRSYRNRQEILGQANAEKMEQNVRVH